MPEYSLIVPIQYPQQHLLKAMVASLQAQTAQDWELVFLTDRKRTFHLDPRVRQVVTQDSLPVVLNSLMDSFGTYVGMMGQHDRLEPDTLERIQGDLFYCEDRHFFSNGWWNQPSRKGGVNWWRLRQQNYFQDLLMVRKEWVQQLGGFDPECSDDPWHDLILRSREARIHYEPDYLYLRHRPYQLQAVTPGYDARAVRKYLGSKAKVDHFARNLRIQYDVSRPKQVTALLLLGDDLADSVARIRAVAASPVYPGATIQAVLLDMDETTRSALEGILDGKDWLYYEQRGSRANTLNQAIRNVQSPYTVLLDGIPLDPRWLQILMSHAQQEKGLHVSGQAMNQNKLTMPGVRGWEYEGWDWNARGHRNQLQVAHNTSMLGDACLAFETRSFQGFEDSPAYIQKYTLGKSCLYVPEVRVHVRERPLDFPTEAFQDMYRTHSRVPA